MAAAENTTEHAGPVLSPEKIVARSYVMEHLEAARLSLMDAAKRIDREREIPDDAPGLPVGLHRDVLFAMDAVRDLEARLTEHSPYE